ARTASDRRLVCLRHTRDEGALLPAAPNVASTPVDDYPPAAGRVVCVLASRCLPAAYARRERASACGSKFYVHASRWSESALASRLTAVSKRRLCALRAGTASNRRLVCLRHTRDEGTLLPAAPNVASTPDDDYPPAAGRVASQLENFPKASF
ncbi:MAG: hypothetical protein IK077_11800, partial [Thermoguttaceae bacterium]|nr:hypothetical protein [Thermoguttaceae bacterium]